MCICTCKHSDNVSLAEGLLLFFNVVYFLYFYMVFCYGSRKKNPLFLAVICWTGCLEIHLLNVLHVSSDRQLSTHTVAI